jgi:hypothetical protein
MAREGVPYVIQRQLGHSIEPVHARRHRVQAKGKPYDN